MNRHSQELAASTLTRTPTCHTCHAKHATCTHSHVPYTCLSAACCFRRATCLVAFVLVHVTALATKHRRKQSQPCTHAEIKITHLSIDNDLTVYRKVIAGCPFRAREPRAPPTTDTPSSGFSRDCRPSAARRRRPRSARRHGSCCVR